MAKKSPQQHRAKEIDDYVRLILAENRLHSDIDIMKLYKLADMLSPERGTDEDTSGTETANQDRNGAA